MRRVVFVLVAVVALAGLVTYIAPASGQADGEAAPIFGVKIPAGYRDWRLISVAREEGNLNESGIRQSAHRSSGDRSASGIAAPRVPVCPAVRPATSIESNAGDVKWPNRSTRIAAASWALPP